MGQPEFVLTLIYHICVRIVICHMRIGFVDKIME